MLGAIDRPIVVNGFEHTDFPCCEAPKHALAWAVAEAAVASTVWAALAEHGAVRPRESTLSRRFACPVSFRAWLHDQRQGRRGPRRHHGASCPVCREGAGLLTAPPTCAGCVALAADPDGLCAAEARVVDLARALAPWGAHEPARVIWRVRDPSQPAEPAAPVPLRLAAAGASMSARRPGMQSASIGSDALRRAAWRRAVDEDVIVQPRAGEGIWPTGASFTSLPDPFAALDALDALGYTLEALTDHDAVLSAPPAELTGPSFGELVELQDRSGTRPGAWPR